VSASAVETECRLSARFADQEGRLPKRDPDLGRPSASR
jgi:hypothetical protein